MPILNVFPSRVSALRICLATYAAIAAIPSHSATVSPDFSGPELYQLFCSGCHGAYGQRAGPLPLAANATLPDLTQISQRYNGKFPADEIYRIIDGQDAKHVTHNSPSMPVGHHQFYMLSADSPDRHRRTDELIMRLVEYLRTLQM